MRIHGHVRKKQRNYNLVPDTSVIINFTGDIFIFLSSCYLTQAIKPVCIIDLGGFLGGLMNSMSMPYRALQTLQDLVVFEIFCSRSLFFRTELSVPEVSSMDWWADLAEETKVLNRRDFSIDGRLSP